MRAILLAACLAVLPARAESDVVRFAYRIPDVGAAPGCGRGAVTRNVGWTRLHILPASGGPRIVAVHDVRGKAGEPDTFVVELDLIRDAGHFFVTATDSTGTRASCRSNLASLAVVPAPSEPADVLISKHTFDVRGRRVVEPRASGVYWIRERWRSGRVVTYSKVLLK